MELRELRCFLVVAEELHIGRAAQRVYLSQPAMSRLVHRIEKTVGTQLLERTSAGVSLTPAGAAFVDDAARILSDFDRAVVRARAISTTQPTSCHRQLRIGMFFPSAAELTKPIVAAFRASAPNVRIEIIDIAGLGGEQALTTGRVDVAFLWSPVVAHDITSIELFQDRFALLVASHHHLAQRARVRLEDVSDERYTVTTSMSTVWQKASMVPQWQGRPEHAVQVRTVTDAMKAIELGAAVSIGPTCLARYAPVRGISYLPLNLTARPISLLCRRTDDERPESHGFLALAAETAKRLAPLLPTPR
jgi:DNA-binding transcriptional LysR family regulator